MISEAFVISNHHGFRNRLLPSSWIYNPSLWATLLSLRLLLSSDLVDVMCLHSTYAKTYRR